MLIELLIRSFIMSDLSILLTIAHLSWATWAIPSRSLISYERNELFAYGRSFVLSDMSESLTVTHLIWAKWANEQWANERIPSPAVFWSFTFNRILEPDQLGVKNLVL